jgi:hypothetical protein
MRRILLLATVAVMMAAMMAVTAGVASATIHRLSCSDEKASDSANGPPGGASNPPGITTSDDPDPDNAPGSHPANTVAANHADDTDQQDDEHSNAVKPGCEPPGQEEE